ncbi:PREDICTED: uncharacterized protein LOC105553563 [Mandrillus leucophaeus]|uniref:uncharacterized protein LOC105553563 n=1 Tax=Mandrillus leucophaeus TaxID=9568 RepID=UPI0005F5573D|nr:PREDICTED: uncharacterized protein LOC105553563 [Mandrillus leucophaeus]
MPNVDTGASSVVTVKAREVPCGDQENKELPCCRVRCSQKPPHRPPPAGIASASGLLSPHPVTGAGAGVGERERVARGGSQGQREEAGRPGGGGRGAAESRKQDLNLEEEGQAASCFLLPHTAEGMAPTASSSPHTAGGMAPTLRDSPGVERQFWENPRFQSLRDSPGMERQLRENPWPQDGLRSTCRVRCSQKPPHRPPPAGIASASGLLSPHPVTGAGAGVGERERVARGGSQGQREEAGRPGGGGRGGASSFLLPPPAHCRGNGPHCLLLPAHCGGNGPHCLLLPAHCGGNGPHILM